MQLNTNLGYYTNFVNLLDLAAVAVPGRLSRQWPALRRLADRPGLQRPGAAGLADRFHRAQTAVPGDVLDLAACPPGCIAVAVVGAHLSGQPLNHELTDRAGAAGQDLPHRARLPPLRAGRHHAGQARAWSATSSFAVRESKSRSGRCPNTSSAASSAGCRRRSESATPSLDDGSTVKCFICEPYAVAGATEITRFGGWRHYLSQALSAR